ncbi:hypothetical protein GCM10009077_07250 [Roseibium denhamense]
MPAQLGGTAPHLQLRLLKLIENYINALQKHLSFVCQFERAAIAMKQCDIQDPFEFCDPMARGRRRDAELPRGCGDPGAFRRRNEGLKVCDAVHSNFSNAEFGNEPVQLKI